MMIITTTSQSICTSIRSYDESIRTHRRAGPGSRARFRWDCPHIGQSDGSGARAMIKYVCIY